MQMQGECRRGGTEKKRWSVSQNLFISIKYSLDVRQDRLWLLLLMLSGLLRRQLLLFIVRSTLALTNQ